MREENKKRRKFDKEQIYFDENILKTIIPIYLKDWQKTIDKRDWDSQNEQLPQSNFDSYLRIQSEDMYSWKSYIQIIYNWTEYKQITFTKLVNEEKEYPDPYYNKISCIESSLERFNAEIIY